MVKKKDNEELDTNILPSQHSDRVETLSIIGKTKDYNYSIFVPFIKVGKEDGKENSKIEI